MASSLTLNDYVQPIPLVKRSHVPYSFEAEKVIVSGWGRTSDASSSSSQILKFVELTVEDLNICISNYGSTKVTANHICTKSETGTKGACSGDSGGPMVSKCNGCLIGIVSFNAATGCESGGPTVYTRVANYLDWIKGITNLNV